MTTAPFEPDLFLKTVSAEAGVYLMYNSAKEVIYVGKARNLKKRLASYFKTSQQSVKTKALVSHIADIQVVITNSENEALLLEYNLIKQHQPRYNVLFRDDKSYPYLRLSQHDKFPRLTYYRGARRGKDKYFGPYPNSYAAKECLQMLQKVFKLRQCSDSFFKNRTRPCLQYQIKRCSAPCVDYISSDDYAESLRQALLFLNGKDESLIKELVQQMEQASQQQAYEQAAQIRDQIARLRQVQSKQIITKAKGNIDVIACALIHGRCCVQFLMIRQGRIMGNQLFYPKVPPESNAAQVLAEFLPQYYLAPAHQHSLPQEIILNESIDEPEWLISNLTSVSHKQLRINPCPRGEKAKWLQMALHNAKSAIARYQALQQGIAEQREALSQALGLEFTLTRMECFDISHTSGEATVASCVVFDENGPKKTDYRRFNISNIHAADDYAALKQAITRRYTRLKQGEGLLPDLLVIDGGKGQLAVAEAVIQELQVTGITLLSIAKGPARKAGQEQLFLSSEGQSLLLQPDNPGFHLLQYLRDEAHRFAVAGHRTQRGKAKVTSPLRSIPGIGAKRAKQLLQHFGGLQALQAASVADLAAVNGISTQQAQQIYQYFHPSETE